MVGTIRSKMTMAGAAALVMAGAFSTPAVAQADPNAAEIAAMVAGIQDCPRKYACLWVDANWSGSRWQGQYNNSTLPTFIRGKASSSYNNGESCPVHFVTQWGLVMTEGIGSFRQNLSLDLRRCSPIDLECGVIESGRWGG